MNRYYFSVPVDFHYEIEANTEEEAKKTLSAKEGRDKMKGVTYVDLGKEDYEKANLYKIEYYDPFTHLRKENNGTNKSK